jgi:hypothetical protein
MFNFFKKSTPNIDSITLPDFGWVKETDNKSTRQWVNQEETLVLVLHFFALKPDIPTITNINTLRDFYRRGVLEAKGGLIEVEKTALTGGYPAIRTLFKFPQQPVGMAYLASLTIPFENYSYVVTVQAPEIGATGVRDTLIFTDFIRNKPFNPENTNNLYEGWFQDPYDASLKSPCLMNKSEDSKYDAQFPNHPLSQARKLLTQLESGIGFKAECEKVKPFSK